MKKVLFSLAVIALVSSCKKDRESAGTQPAFKKNLVTVKAAGQTEWSMLYSNDQKLFSFSNNSMTVSYKPGVPFSAKKTASGEVHEYKNAVQDAQGRVIRLDRYVGGLLASKQEFSYNAEGHLSQQIITATNPNHFVKYVYEYQAGNLTTISVYEGGIKTASFVFEYYTSQYNPLQIDLFDFKGIQFVTDTQFGKQSKNLAKNAKLIAADGQVFASIDMSYTSDPDGYIKTITQSLSGQSATVYTCIFQ